jgi:predicted amidohydrolase
VKKIKTLKITAFQPKVKLNDLDYNIENYIRLLEKHSLNIRKSHVLCFPEYWDGIRKNFYSDELYEHSITFLKGLAIKYSIWIIGGSQITQENGKFFNRTHIFDPTGKLVGSYDKKQLFGFENIQNISPGNKDMIWNIQNWNCGVRICSDLWNTSDYSRLLIENLDLLFCPALTVVPDCSYTNYGRFLWHNLALIRSKESATSIVVSDTAVQTIREPFCSTGATCIVDPSKKFTNEENVCEGMISANKNGEEGVVSAIINLDEIRQQREYRKGIGLLKID